MLKTELEKLIKEWDAAILGWENLAKEGEDKNPPDLRYKAYDLLHASDLRLCRDELQEILDRH